MDDNERHRMCERERETETNKEMKEIGGNRYELESVEPVYSDNNASDEINAMGENVIILKLQF